MSETDETVRVIISKPRVVAEVSKTDFREFMGALGEVAAKQHWEIDCVELVIPDTEAGTD